MQNRSIEQEVNVEADSDEVNHIDRFMRSSCPER